MAGRIEIKGPFPPPTGVVGPNARRTESHTYAIYNDEGRKLVGGTFGPDREVGLEHARRVASRKGLNNPAVD